MPYIDLTHTFTADMPVYPGDPKAELKQIAEHQSNGFCDHQLTTSMHVGTHIDAPLHMLEGDKQLSDIPIAQFFGRGCLIDARGRDTIVADLLSQSSVQEGDILLVMTGFSKKYRQPEYFERYPEISEGFAAKAIALGVKMIGVDTPSPDRSPFTVHKQLLAAGVLILENLTNLEQLVGITDVEVIALPAKLAADGAPVRVVAKV